MDFACFIFLFSLLSVHFLCEGILPSLLPHLPYSCEFSSCSEPTGNRTAFERCTSIHQSEHRVYKSSPTSDSTTSPCGWKYSVVRIMVSKNVAYQYKGKFRAIFRLIEINSKEILTAMRVMVVSIGSRGSHIPAMTPRRLRRGVIAGM